MQQIYEKEALVAPSACDYDGLLGYPGPFALFMDLATEHALHLGVGFAAMRERDCFWLTVKTPNTTAATSRSASTILSFFMHVLSSMKPAWDETIA